MDVEALLREETEWLGTASVNDKAIYESLIKKLKKSGDTICVSDYIGRTNDKTALLCFEESLFSWKDKKM